MSFYSELQQEALDLLTEFGDTFTINLTAIGGSIRVKGVFIAKKQYNTETQIPSLLLSTQRQCIIQGKVTKPVSVNDTLVYNKVTYTITEVEQISPTNTPLVHKLTVEY